MTDFFGKTKKFYVQADNFVVELLYKMDGMVPFIKEDIPMAFMSDKDKVFFTGLTDQLCTDYAFHRDVARHIAMKAWDNQHSNGYDDVLEEAIELSEFVESILWLEMGNAGNHCFDESKYKGSIACEKFQQLEK